MAEAKPKGMLADARPLSPHLQIYSLLINMVMSGLHRVTGAALYFGTLILAVWLMAAASGRGAYTVVAELLGTPAGLLVLFGYTWALIHHALGGIRHFIWDTGRGFDLKFVELMARANLIGSLVLTVLLWLLAYGVRP